MFKDRYYTKSDLKKNGWTDGLIKDYNLEHDQEAQNPYDNSRPNMKLYNKDKIHDIEKTEEFKERLRWATWFRGHMKDVAQRRKNS